MFYLTDTYSPPTVQRVHRSVSGPNWGTIDDAVHVMQVQFEHEHGPRTVRTDPVFTRCL